MPMKKPFITTFIFLGLITLISCGKESLIPMVEPKTVNALRNDEAIHFSYSIDPTQIDEYAKGIKKFPIFGKIFQGMAVVLANSTIISKGGMPLEMQPMDLDLNSLGDVDFKFIDWISLDSLQVSIDNVKRKDSLKFIEKIEVYAQLENNLPGVALDSQGMTRLVYYDASKNGIDCDGGCINLKIEKLDWKELIKNNPRIKLLPKIVINSVPKSSMALAGSVSFSIKFEPGF
jgi:hypothetical protein